MQGWRFSKDHLIRAGVGAGTDYQQVFKVYFGDGVDGTEVLNGETVGKVCCGGKCKTDFGDIRFSNQAGSKYLYRLCSSVASSYAVYVVKVSEDSDVDRWVRVWYGNASAADASSDNAVIDVVGGVVGAWTMDEASASDPVVDYSGNGNDGVATGTTIGTTSPKFVNTNYRIFNGVSDVITLLSNLTLADTFTVSFWIKRNTAVSYDMVVGKATGEKIGFSGGSTFSRFIAGGSSDSSVVLGTGTWRLVTVTRDSNNKGDVHVDDGNAVRMFGNVAQVGDFIFNVIGDDVATHFLDADLCNLLVFNICITPTQKSNIYAGYGDSSLVEGSVLVRKWASTTLPTHDLWTTETHHEAARNPPKTRRNLINRRTLQLYNIAVEYLEFKVEQRKRLKEISQ